jgi:hypothetical protein
LGQGLESVLGCLVWREDTRHAPLFQRRSISRSWEKDTDGGQGCEKASKRRAYVQVMRPATARRDATPPPDCTRDQL